ncbi:Acetate kinase [Acaryochloris thomasi RCC1774]|uniref:Acetate kinase n=1 Tax=Acaryochloris thomasi RCC1774 TaxID=1764569 RepID=A0A2W1JAP8_9CYAN|nr:acetate kinase [Acaryochloris thomasi]PZD71210.1 Acetate kinase [Acaryochloris thomasi RCC1774]
MKILVLNAGSSSHKCCLYTIKGAIPESPATPLWEAQLDWHAPNHAALVVKTAAGEQREEDLSSVTRADALSHLLETLWQGETQAIQNLQEIDVVGHRVVHGGQAYQASVRVTDEVKDAIATLSPLAPTHNPAHLEGIEIIERLLGQVPQVAVFDTAFHSQMPAAAAIYPGPYDWIEQGIRRYGFHGISHQYCTQRAFQILGRTVERLIVCHLGNGASLTAVKNGQSINTTMGYTPLDGLMMGTRSGAVDPGILIHLMRQGHTADQLDRLLNKESGLKGISGISHDLRKIEDAIVSDQPASKRGASLTAIANGSERAKLARDIYLHRLKSCLGEMLVSLGGLDALVFTAGIGEHSASIRAETCEALAFLGLQIDLAQNDSSPVDQDIARANSTARVLVIKTQEDWAIAQACYEHL